MPSAKTIRAGKAEIELGVLDKTDAALRKVGAKFKAFGAGLKSLGGGLAIAGGAGLAVVGEALANFTSFGSEIANVSARTGIAAETLIAWRFAAEQVGGGLSDIEMGFRRLAKAMNPIDAESKKSAAALDLLGLSADELQKLGSERAMMLVAERLGNYSDEAERAAIATQLFGSAGFVLLPLFANSAAELKRLTARAKELGIVMIGDDVKAADRLSNAVSELILQFRALRMNAVAALAPIASGFIGAIQPAIARAIDWAKANRLLFVGIAVLSIGLNAAGAALFAFGTFSVYAGAGIATLGTVLSGTWAVLVGFGGAAMSLLSPLGVLAAGIVAVAAAAIYLTGVFDVMVDVTKKDLAGMADTTRSTVQGMADALMGGDLGLAASIGWQGVKIAWAEGVFAIKEAWEGLWGSLRFLGIEAMAGIGSVVIAGLNKILEGTHAATVAVLGFDSAIAAGLRSAGGALAGERSDLDQWAQHQHDITNQAVADSLSASRKKIDALKQEQKAMLATAEAKRIEQQERLASLASGTDEGGGEGGGEEAGRISRGFFNPNQLLRFGAQLEPKKQVEAIEKTNAILNQVKAILQRSAETALGTA